MIHQLSVVMSMDFSDVVSEVHTSLSGQAGDDVKSISNDTLARLANVISSLGQEKEKRLQKVTNHLSVSHR